MCIFNWDIKVSHKILISVSSNVQIRHPHPKGRLTSRSPLQRREQTWRGACRDRWDAGWLLLLVVVFLIFISVMKEHTKAIHGGQSWTIARGQAHKKKDSSYTYIQQTQPQSSRRENRWWVVKRGFYIPSGYKPKECGSVFLSSSRFAFWSLWLKLRCCWLIFILCLLHSRKPRVELLLACWRRVEVRVLASSMLMLAEWAVVVFQERKPNQSTLTVCRGLLYVVPDALWLTAGAGRVREWGEGWIRAGFRV